MDSQVQTVLDSFFAFTHMSILSRTLHFQNAQYTWDGMSSFNVLLGYGYLFASGGPFLAGLWGYPAPRFARQTISGVCPSSYGSNSKVCM